MVQSSAPIALIEGGGSWFRCSVATESSRIEVEQTIATTTPEETLAAVTEFFAQRSKSYAAVGLACFGPLDIDSDSPTFGRMLDTPKPGWSGFDVTGFLKDRLHAPVSFHTDVIGAGLGEWVEGAARGVQSLLYITVGTGIGGGAIVNGVPVSGRMHSELGHVSLRREPGDRFPGVCPFHGNCLEGLASGPSISKRAMKKAETLPLDHPVLVRATGYLAQAIANFVLTLAPDVVVMGGGVMRGGEMLQPIRTRIHEHLRDYLPRFKSEAAIEQLVVGPALAERSALVGARELVTRGQIVRR